MRITSRNRDIAIRLLKKGHETMILSYVKFIWNELFRADEADQAYEAATYKHSTSIQLSQFRLYSILVFFLRLKLELFISP